VVELDVHYDCWTPGRTREPFTAAGFEQLEISVCWSQSGYFLPVFPRLPAGGRLPVARPGPAA
jgi:hypothetical protein